MSRAVDYYDSQGGVSLATDLQTRLTTLCKWAIEDKYPLHILTTKALRLQTEFGDWDCPHQDTRATMLRNVDALITALLILDDVERMMTVRNLFAECAALPVPVMRHAPSDNNNGTVRTIILFVSLLVAGLFIGRVTS